MESEERREARLSRRRENTKQREVQFSKWRERDRLGMPLNLLLSNRGNCGNEESK